MEKQPRSKTFLSYDGLCFEKERLATFIEWPVPWLSPSDLAADGFYYLRTKDHCACVFCRGIVGAWEVGDTPRGEHQRHFPHCSFIRGQPVGNIPLKLCELVGGEFPLPPQRCDIARSEPVEKYSSYGLRRYTGPMVKDYITNESRLKSFSRQLWPERVVQKPEEMAEAGFFYCGLSDHVRCFHCGGGLHNWEMGDEPWEEHARWYPNCNFLLLSKGQQYVDDVQCKRPLLLHSASKPQINDRELDRLMELDITHAVKCMGFPLPTIRKALQQRLQQTGMPFFTLECCIETVLTIMEKEAGQKSKASAPSMPAATAATISSHRGAGSESSTTVGPPDAVATSIVLPSSSRTADEPNEATETLAAEGFTTSGQNGSLGKKIVDDAPGHSGPPSNADDRTCKVCLDAEARIVFLPCAHMATCVSCATALAQCPICRQDIQHMIKPFFS